MRFAEKKLFYGRRRAYPQRSLVVPNKLVNFKARLTQNLHAGAIGAAVSITVGLLLWFFSGLGAIWEHASFDLPFVFGERSAPTNVWLVTMDEVAHRALQQTYGEWDRKLHAGFLDRLREGESKLVVFDVLFADPGNEATNAVLAEAMRRHGRVALMAAPDRVAQPSVETQPGFKGKAIVRPRPEFEQAATNWGVAEAELDADLVVRRHYPGAELYPSLPWIAAKLVNAPVTANPDARLTERWLHYYGPPGTLNSLSYDHALAKSPRFFTDKIVFIGGKPKTKKPGEESDEFFTPFKGSVMSGMEIQATAFLNLVHGDWLRRVPRWLEFFVLLGTGFGAGFGLCLVRPLPAVGLAFLGSVAAGLSGILLVWLSNYWFAWAVVAGGQIPFALGWSVLRHSVRGLREPAPAPEGSTVLVDELPSTERLPEISEHVLIGRIGRGAYGEVWLARDVIGAYHAVKVIYQKTFGANLAPFEREFNGICRYSPISLTHPGLLHILLVGRREQAGYFFYIMELGDAEQPGWESRPKTYSARNLGKELTRLRRLPLGECVRLGLALTSALDHLHAKGLIHRDIKPSNIVFVKGVPKLADIGLVTEIRAEAGDVSYLGTEGYIAPEGPGTPMADIYSLGIVLYEAGSGCRAEEFPILPDTFYERPERDHFLRLNDIILKACDQNPAGRYHSAAEMHAALLEVQQQLTTP